MPRRTKPGSKTFESKPNPAPWRNRIIGYGEEAPSQLVAHDKNWRIHTDAQRAALEGILREVGVVQNVIINRTTGKLLDGHLRVEMAIAEGCPTVPITYVELTEAEERLILATLDPLSAMAVTDQDLLAGLVGELNVSDEAIQALLNELAGNKPKAGLTDDDATPDLPSQPVSKLGDLWLCGNLPKPHRVLCSDATSPEAVSRLLGEHKPFLMVTDPPYGISLDSEWRDRAGLNGCGPAEASYMKHRSEGHTETTISGDTRADWSGAFALVPSLEVAYVWHASKFTREVLDGLLRIGFLHHQQIIWSKTTAALTRTHYWFKHEPCWYVRKKNAPWLGKPGENTTIWEAASPKMIMGGSQEEKFDHPTQKPVELMRRPILNHTVKGEVVYEPFLGSSTTLIAAESTERICFGCEIDPRYVDMGILRWQNYTGKEATLEGDGRTFAEIARSRAPEVPNGTGVGTETTA
jgi:DNA modification methylase